jgi:predicted alpha/beta superfamily hydrolase
MKNILSFIVIVLFGMTVLYSQVQVSSGKVVRLENFSSKYVASRNVDVWLPESYNENQKYAVLYMHDGQMLYDAGTTWNKQEWKVDEHLSELIKNEIIKPTIVVGIWNSGPTRHIDYFPQAPFESLTKEYQDSLYQVDRQESQRLFAGKVQSDQYLKFIVEELKPYIDTNFSTISDKENTSIMGSSMGGLISMYAICEYPQVFGSAACISTHWPGAFDPNDKRIPQAFVNYMELYLPCPFDHKIYFDFGTETIDAWYEPYQVMVDEKMINAGFDENSWMTKKFEGANHSEDAWNSRLQIPLEFLLKK